MTYGVIPPVDGLSMDEVMFGLHLNIEQVQAKQAFNMRRAIVAAMDEKATGALMSDCGFSDMDVAVWMAAQKVTN